MATENNTKYKLWLQQMLVCTQMLHESKKKKSLKMWFTFCYGNRSSKEIDFELNKG